MSKPTDLVQGTLDLLILKIIALEPMHGWAIAQRIRQMSGEVLQVGQSALYPSLHKLEHNGWITAEWAISENNRRAKLLHADQVGQEGPGAGGGAVGTAGRGDHADRAHVLRGSITMRILSLLRLRLRSLLSGTQLEHELDEELRVRRRARQGARGAAQEPLLTREVGGVSGCNARTRTARPCTTTPSP